MVSLTFCFPVFYIYIRIPLILIPTEQLRFLSSSADEAELIKLAAWAADAAYHDSIDPEDPNTKAQHFTLFKRIAANCSGNFKAVTLWHTSSEQPNSGTVGFVAIRGSALLIDWLVNADGDAGEVDKDFLVRCLPLVYNTVVIHQ